MKGERTTEPTMAGGVRLKDDGGRLRVVVSVRGYLSLLVLVGVWVGPLFAGSVGGRGLLLFWMVLWAVPGGFAAVITVWMVLGREVATVEGGILSLRQEVFGLGRERRYDFAEVRNLRGLPRPVDPGSGRYRSTLQEGGLIAFDYRGKTVRFGLGLDETQAQLIAARLAARDPRRR